MNNSISGRSSYWDIDDILAEEELIPVTNLFDFRFLAHLDPDYVHTSASRKSRPVSLSPTSGDKDNGHGMSTPPSSVSKRRFYKKDKLKEGTRWKMPLWSIREWSTTGFVNLSLPRHYGRKIRERISVDPTLVDLRKRNERFFLSGIFLVDMLQERVRAIRSSHSSTTKSSRKRQQAEQMKNLSREAKLLQYALLHTYTGERMRRTYDWTCSHMEEDVSDYTSKLTEMERRLFARGAAASHAFQMWKLHGSRRIHVSETALKASVLTSRCSNVNTMHRDGDKNTRTPHKRDRANLVSPEDGRSSRSQAMMRHKRSRMVY